ncbi:winged helix DNA-binding domain-containing protein, partial [Calocera viscosa TUFC12733]
MILDPKAAPFIAWTDMGASFVVSSVTEFSKTVLGSHFKHNNFSSFVRQLNMYGFHKINRTPRASRSTGTDQTWEFSHPKFLRGRPDLLDEIKRKALEPDLTARQRVELPAEVANQLGGVEGRIEQIAAQLEAEKEKNQRLAAVVRQLCDWLANMYPGQ